MAWEENSRICLHMQIIVILSRTGVIIKTETARAYWREAPGMSLALAPGLFLYACTEHT